MELPGYATVNLGASAAITASTTDAVYPLSYLVDRIMGRPARSASLTDWWVQFDMGSPVELNGWGVFAHNFTPGMTAVLKGGGSPAPSTTVATFTYEKGSLFTGFTPVAHRYWWFEVSDTNTEFLQAGEIFPMLYDTFPRGIRFGGPQRRKERKQHVKRTVGGVTKATHFYTKRTPDFAFRVLDSQLDEFDALDDLLIGQLYPFVFIPDTGASKAIYGRMQSSDFVPVELDEPATEPVSDYIFSIAEESPGKRILF